MMGDAGYEAAVRAVLSDPGVDVGVVGCVPLTPALNTLVAGAQHGEDVSSPESVASRVAAVVTDLPKACVAVVDGGAIYDGMAARLTEFGIPTFRSADRALRLLEVAVRSYVH
jgi:hypothetical protein